MYRYLAMRAVQGLATMLLVSVLIFLLARSTGDPALLMLPLTATPDEVAAMRQRLGTDQPLPVQYGRFLASALSGDLGRSTRLRLPVTELLLEFLPASLLLAGAAMGLAMLASLALGSLPRAPC